ncbi:MAG: hypothetical protein ACYCWE_05595 [Eubacteriales bacterium]
MKKIIYYIIFFILFNSLYSCNNDKLTADEPDLFYPVNVFKKTEIILPENMTLKHGTLYADNGRYRMLCADYSDNAGKYFIYSAGFDGTDATLTPLIVINDGAEISLAAFEKNGSYYTYEVEFESNKYYLSRFAEDGSLLYSISLDSASFAGGIINLVPLDDGTIYISSDSVIVKISETGNIGTQIKTRSTNEQINNIKYIGDRLYIGITNKDTLKYLCLYAEGDTDTVTGEIKITENYNVNFFGGPDFDMYYYNDSSLYGYDMIGNESEIISLTNSCVSDRINNFTVIDAENMVYIYLDMGTYTFHAAQLTKVPDDQIVPKEIINMACIDGVNIRTKLNISDFNGTNGKYHVICEDYKYNENMSADEQLSLDIIAGRVPDVIVSGENYNLENYAEKNLLCDLYGFMEDDPDINRDDLLSCIKIPFESDGKLYRLVTNFSIDTIAGKVKNIGNQKSWSLSEILAYEKNLPQDVSLFGSVPQGMVTSIFMKTGLDTFVDYNTAACSFDGDEFISLLEYLSALSENVTQDTGYRSYRDDKTILYSLNIRSLSDYIQMMYFFNFDELNLIGNPVKSGSGTIIVPQCEYGISADSPVKDGAWELLKFLMRDECLYDEEIGQLKFPATVSAMDKYIDSYHNHVFVYDNNTEMLFSCDSKETAEKVMTASQQIYIITQEDLAPLLDAFNSIDKTMSDINRSRIREIVFEELNIFLRGAKKAEETAEIIQSRVSIYLSENK